MILFFQTLSLKTRFVFVLLAFLAMVGAFALFESSPIGVSQLKILSSGHGVLGSVFWYDADQVTREMTAWGVDGRSYFATILFPISLLIPLSTVTLFTVAFLYLLKRINPRFALFYLLPVLTWIAGGAEVLSSATIWILALVFPVDTTVPNLIFLILNLVKWVFWSFCVTVTVVLVSWHLIQRLRSKLTKHANPLADSPSDR